MTGTVTEEQIDDAPADFPRVDDRRSGLRAQYGYLLGLDQESSTLTYDRYLYKYNLETGARERQDLGAGWHGGEACFVPRSPDAAEDDGWILSIVHDDGEDASFLAILDAQNFTEAPVAKVRLPRRVPYGAHSNWIAD